MKTLFKSLSALVLGLALLSVSSSAMAGGIDPAVLKKILGTPAVKSGPLYLTNNEDKLIRLDEDAASVIVNNPDHARVLLDSPRLLIVMPRAPGATSFSVLNADGHTILHRDIIVSNVKRQYVRIQRICGGSGADCAPTSYYYCPNGCYQVTPVGSDSSSGNVPPPNPPAAESAARLGSASGDGAPVQNILHTSKTRVYPGIMP